MDKRRLTQYQVGHSVEDGDDGCAGSDDNAGNGGYSGKVAKHGKHGRQNECASDVHGETAPVPPIRRMAPPRVALQPPAVTRLKEEPAHVKEVKALCAPLEGNPWAEGRYETAYVTQDFDGDAAVAVGAERVVLIRQFPRSDQHIVQLYLQLRHRNVVEVVEAFYDDDFHYIVMEEMTLCLHHFVRCPTLPSCEQLRSILVQVLDGLLFLHSMGLGYDAEHAATRSTQNDSQRFEEAHHGLRCRNILVNRLGQVKLANLEKLAPLTAESKNRDAAAVGEVTLHLMQKDAGRGVRDSRRWHAFLSFVALAASASGVAQLRGHQILADVSPGHERSIVALYYTAAVASLKLYKIAEDPSKKLDQLYAVILFAAFGSLLFRRPLAAVCRFVAPIALRRAIYKLPFRRLVRRRSLFGPFYTCKVLAYAIVFALNAVVLSVETRETEKSAFSVRLATLSDATARAKYLALLNLTVTYISPHHYGVADVFGLSLQLFQQVHRVAGLLSLSLILFPISVALAEDPRRFVASDEGRIAIMVIACMAALVAASLVKPVAYEVFLKLHEISAALLAYLLLSQVLADSSFNRLPLYIYGGVAGLLNAFFLCRCAYYNFAGRERPRLTCSEIAASRIHSRRWLHLKLEVPRRVHVRPGQYISVWIPGVQLLSSHPFAPVTTTGIRGTVFHLFVQSRSGMTKTLARPLLPSATAADELERQTVVVRLNRKGAIVQTKQTVDQSQFIPRFAFFTGPHGRSVDHRKFETVILVASGFGYWSLDGYLEDMLRTARADTRTQMIVLVYKGRTPIMIEEAINKRLRDDADNPDGSMKKRLRVVFYPADLRKDAFQDDSRFCDMDKLGRMKKSKPPGRREKSMATNEPDKVPRHKVGNKGRLSFLPEAPLLKDVVEDPYAFETGVKYTTKQSSFDYGSANETNTLILASAENQVVDELKQAVATSKKKLRLHVLDFIPAKSRERGDDEFEVRRVQSPAGTPG